MTLGRLGVSARPAIPGLIQQLKDEDVRVRAEVLVALKRIGPDAAAGLQQALKEELVKPEGATSFLSVVTDVTLMRELHHG